MAWTSIVPAGPRAGTGGRRARRAAIGLGLVLLVIGIGYLVAMRSSRITPPAIDPEVVRRSELPLRSRGRRAYVGESWMSRERGIWELHLQGSPYALGWAQGRLGNRLILEQEDYMFGEMARYIPSRVARFLVRAGVQYRYRHLGDFLPRARQEEIAGLARGIHDAHGDFLPPYHRMVFYHALHDITQRLEHSPLLGCSAFAASGAATTTGHLILGRNFDFEGPEIFDRDKAILFFRPAGKIAFASVAWAGMSGVVTGINAAGIYVSVNAARTEDRGDEGVPVEILIREILEQARSVAEVVAIVRKTPVIVPDFYLVGDGKTGEAVVIERSPTRIEVRRTAGDPIVLTNHALGPSFAQDAENDRLRRYLTSGARYRRLHELVQRWRGLIDPPKALEILRDKRGAGGAERGLGNRNTLDALIATHSVVVDATSMVLWVGQGPHLLGRYVAFDLRKELLGEDRPPPADLPADPVADSPELRAHREAEVTLALAERLRLTDPSRALEEARRASALDEQLPEAHRLIGDLSLARGDHREARRHYQRFLALDPPYLKDVEEVKGLLGTL